MNKRERVITALHGGKPDRVPAGFWFHFTGDAVAGQNCIDAHLDYFKQCDLDIMKIMCDSYFDYPNPCKVEKASDWYNLQPMGPDHPFFKEQVERTKAIVDAVGKEALVLYTVFAPFSSIRFGYGEELVMRTMQEDPAAVCHALDVIAEDNKMFVKALFEVAGADGIYYSVQGGEKNRFTVEEYRKWITPSDKAVLDYANTLGDLNILHCCGWAGDRNNIEDWQDYTAAAVNWAVYVEKMTMAEGRAFFPNVKCVLGGLDNTANGMLYTGTDDEVKAEIARLIEETGDAGYIIGADCSIQSDTPYDRIKLAVTHR
ncbi:MAG: hypothetical protein IJF56_01175 [Clostridia bacterium]|nr:hypothetical protein [Clostridia bacterium]